ncbi:hypothetical protein D9M71_820080 [compost metagenome]
MFSSWPRSQVLRSSTGSVPNKDLRTAVWAIAAIAVMEGLTIDVERDEPSIKHKVMQWIRQRSLILEMRRSRRALDGPTAWTVVSKRVAVRMVLGFHT